ncbi:hypothetical protein GGI11_004555, partial [Coemansia sp. RSA 2049]
MHVPFFVVPTMEDPVELLDSKAELDQEEIERLLRENRSLKGRLDELERENRLLKQRNFDLSMRYGRSVENRRQPFEIVFSDSDLDEDEDSSSNNDSKNNNKDKADESNDGNRQISDTFYDNESINTGQGSKNRDHAIDKHDLDPGLARVAENGNSIDSAVPFSETSTNIIHTQSADNNVSNRISGARYNSVNDAAPGSEVSNTVSNTTLHDTNHTSPSQETSNVGDKSNPGIQNTPGGLQEQAAEKSGDYNEGPESFGKENCRESAMRAPDTPDSSRDGNTKNGDGEAGILAREKRGMRDGEDQRLGTAGGGSGGGAGRRREAKQLKCYAELDGHEGAIYSTQYSHSGNLVASASFDKSVRIWDIGEQKQVAALNGHQQTVFDVAWRYDSAAVVSAGFDRMCIEWDLETRLAIAQLQCDGLVQSVRYSTHNPRIVYSGDSSGFITIHDLRQPQSATKLSNDGSMVNTIYCFKDETRLVSGDRNGEIKMWDV